MKNSIKIQLCLLTLSLLFSASDVAFAKRKSSREVQPVSAPVEISAVDETASDADIVRAVEDRRRVDFVEGGSMEVVKVLPDDRNGAAHQKWVVRLSNGKTMNAVYNSDMCPRVPVKVGDIVAMGGQFLWTNSGPLLHWLHGDPRSRRSDGYVYLKGTYYCKDLN